VISFTAKEVIIHIARCVLGENRVHDYLIRRGIDLRHLRDGYTENGNISESFPKSNNERLEANSTTKANSDHRQTLVFMADGKWMHGGLTDRLRGMASAYKFATEHNLDFKIFHTSPFLLQEILQQNKTNWIIGESEISKECTKAKPILLYREDFDNDSALERQLDATHEQFHLYSCVDTLGEKFPEYFNTLFKPSPLLEKELAYYNELLGTNYTSISFRFQNMLGDFKEFTFKELPPASKQALLDNALNALKKEIAETSQAPQDLPGMQKILVTADSPTFLEQAAKFPNVVIVKGTSIHIDFNSSKNATDYLKAFTEFFLISKAAKAKLYRNRKYKTYPSNFPKYAAKLGHVPYEIMES
jgi:hypothetical protein